jgi:hypothetical protein
MFWTQVVLILLLTCSLSQTEIKVRKIKTLYDRYWTLICGCDSFRCDGNLPACAACSSVYNTECVYDPNSDHRRKGVYRRDEKLKGRESTLEVLIQAILNVPDDEVMDLVQQIRTCDSLDAVAEAVLTKEDAEAEDDNDQPDTVDDDDTASPTLANQLSTKMGELRMEDGSARYIGGTSNLLFLGELDKEQGDPATAAFDQLYADEAKATTSWTEVTDDPELITHLLTMYFTWHYTYFTTLSKSLFFRDFNKGCPPPGLYRKTEYCTPLLVNAMLALGCHFTAWPGSREIKEDSATAGDHFFRVLIDCQK